MKTTNAIVEIRGVPGEMTFGYDEEDEIFGLVMYQQFTSASYYVGKYFIPKRVIGRTRANGGNFFLDVGKAWIIKADELERVFKELGIW